MASDDQREPSRRRRYDDAFKQAVVEQTLAQKASVARIAREHDLNANQLFQWRRQWLLNGHFRTVTRSTEKRPVSLIPVTVEERSPEQSSGPATMIGEGQIEIRLTGGEVRIRGAWRRGTDRGRQQANAAPG